MLWDDEEEILLYVVHLGITMSRAAGTVKAKLFALRQMHVMGGYPDPLQGKLRLWMALKGLERRRGPARRKLPTTPGMLKWIRTQLHPETCANDAVLWAGLMRAFFFLMRVGEYALSGHWDLKKVFTPADLKGPAAGQPVTDYRLADEIILRFKSSKADQEGAGATRNHYRTNERLCPVEAVELLQRHPGHRMARELDEPLLQWEDNSPLTRDHIQAILERGAVAMDLPPHRFRSHSLRIGGATALYHVYHDVDIIKSCGRWTIAVPSRDTFGKLMKRRKEWLHVWHGMTPRYSSTALQTLSPPPVFPLVTRRAEWDSPVRPRPLFFGSQRSKHPARYRGQTILPRAPWGRRRGEGGALPPRPRRARPGRRLRRSHAALPHFCAMAWIARGSPATQEAGQMSGPSVIPCGRRGWRS